MENDGPNSAGDVYDLQLRKSTDRKKLCVSRARLFASLLVVHDIAQVISLYNWQIIYRIASRLCVKSFQDTLYILFISKYKQHVLQT